MKTHMMPQDCFLTRPDGKCFMREVSLQAHSISILVNPSEVLSFLYPQYLIVYYRVSLADSSLSLTCPDVSNKIYP